MVIQVRVDIVELGHRLEELGNKRLNARFEAYDGPRRGENQLIGAYIVDNESHQSGDVGDQ